MQESQTAREHFAGAFRRRSGALVIHLLARPGQAVPVDLLEPHVLCVHLRRLARDVDDETDPFGWRARPLLIGGALTSAAVSLAGAVIVAWRLSRPAHPMVRAIRAAHDRAGHQGGLA